MKFTRRGLLEWCVTHTHFFCYVVCQPGCQMKLYILWVTCLVEPLPRGTISRYSEKFSMVPAVKTEGLFLFFVIEQYFF